MPIITIESGQLKPEVKQELLRQLTTLAAEITQIPVESFIVSIRELPDENIAVGGKTVQALKADVLKQ